MNQQQLRGNWQQIKGKFHEQWGRLTDDDLEECQGKAESLIGKITERYGMKKEEAERKFNQYLEKLDSSGNPLREVVSDVANVARDVTEKTSETMKDYWQFAKDKPLATLGVAAAAGAILGILLTRSSHR